MYPFLMTVFFVLHGYLENFGFIRPVDGLLLVMTYGSSAALLYAFFYVLYRDHPKAALLTTYVLGFYLFFGALHDFFQGHHILLHRYSVILPIFLVVLAFMMIYFRRMTNTFAGATVFLNLLFIVYILVDLAQLSWKLGHPTPNQLSTYDFARTRHYAACDSCSKPDIYLLLFDEYASSWSLMQRFHYDNQDLDSFLESSGFRIQAHSRSNYNFTPFSMASILNMSYLSGIQDPGSCTLEDYRNCENLIRDNAVISYLGEQGYEIVNYSVFDLAGNPSRIQQTFLPLNTKLITDRTLLHYVLKDIGWMLYVGPLKINWLANRMMLRNSVNNQTIIDLVKKESAQKSDKPKFVYAHVYMPHPPYFFDKHGLRRDLRTVYERASESDYQYYLDYIPYTNQKAKELIHAIAQNTGHRAVIIFLGDHGLRYTLDPSDQSNYFENQNALYFPARDYRLVYDSVSGVNEFRLVFNTLFHAGFPILKDSTILLQDSK
jgi:Sulfatase